MFRIELDDKPEAMILRIEGRLAGDCVDELRRVWTEVRSKSAGKESVVELSCVICLDHSGRKLLAEMHSGGTRLSGCGLVIASLIEEITGAAAAAV